MPAPIKLGLTAKPKAAAPAARPARASAFGDDDDGPVTGPKASTSRLPPPTSQSTAVSRAQQKKIAEAKALDATVYEYDEVYDYLKEGERQVAEERAKENAERKPRYIEGLIKTAAIRKLDHARAEDKMMEKERAREGEEFAEKDAFVTPAYLAQQEEIRKAEEEEKRKDEASGKKRTGLPAFYAQYLENNEAKHAAAMKAAAEKPKLGPSAPPPPPSGDDTLPSAAALAAEAATRTGQKVTLNEDGQIVDKRELLTGGLNVSRKPAKTSTADGNSGFAVPIAQRAAEARAAEEAAAAQEAVANRGLTPAQRHRLAKERMSADIERQLIEAAEKKRAAEEAEHDEGVKRYTKRNAGDRVEEMKRLAAERRAKREAELAAAIAAEPAPA